MLDKSYDKDGAHKSMHWKITFGKQHLLDAGNVLEQSATEATSAEEDYRLARLFNVSC